MRVSRREFTGGALGLALTGQIGGKAIAQQPAPLAPALDAIRSYAQAHVRHFGLPGMTLGLTAPNGFATVLHFGFAEREAKRPIGPDTLFQIGSISKIMTAALIHQLAAEGRLRLADRVSSLLPAIPLPAVNAVTVQQLLDHTAGLPDSAPIFPDGGLWTGFAPGTRWHYSNTGYDILGKIAEHAGGKPLARLMEERIFAPLGMRRSRAAILGADRLLYAQGYEPADPSVPYARGAPLAPAAWVDVTFGAGNVASTAEDMNRFMRALAGAAQGGGGFDLAPRQAAELVRRSVPSDTPEMRYGNGLMHVANAGRSYLHHTGGMVSFSSAFHVDVASGVGAFASSTISAFADYRPRLLTRFAADAVTDALAGRPVPPPPPLDRALANPPFFHGRYAGPDGAFEVRPGSPLTIVAAGEPAPLQYWGGDLFRTTHPRFRAFTLKFERTAGAITGASWGPSSYARDGVGGPVPKSDPALARFTGRYVNDSPWWGVLVVVERGGRLWIGTETPLTPIGENLWRAGEKAWSPERASFANVIDGRPQTFIFSGEKFLRHDV